MSTATRHRCISAVSPHCTRGTGKPTRAKCGRCGSSILVERGHYGVFTWTGDGRYPRENAHRLFVRESAADRWAIATHPEYVVRWVGE